MAFNDRLLELRKESGLNQKECAESLNAEKSKYNKWETGANRPDYETVCKIADHYNVTTDYLLGHSDARHVENQSVIEDLQLTDQSIQAIKDMKDRPIHSMAKQQKELPHDGRRIIDILNSSLCSPSFRNMLLEIGYLSDPTIDQWQNFSYIDGLDGEGYPAKTAYKQMAHERLDDLVSELREKEIEKGKGR